MYTLDVIRNGTKTIEPWWTFIGAPVIQEILFRYIPYKYLYLPFGKFWLIGIVGALLFASIHWYFGKLFLAYSFLWGLLLWLLMARFGVVVVILIHIALNILHVRLGVIRLDKNPFGKRS